MKAQELRIGNWLLFEDRFFKIHTISDVYPTLDTMEFGIGVVDYNNIKPIPLTEEILLKCGFIYTDDDNEYMSLIRGIDYKFISSDISINFSSVWLNKENTTRNKRKKYMAKISLSSKEKENIIYLLQRQIIMAEKALNTPTMGNNNYDDFKNQINTNKITIKKLINDTTRKTN